MDTIEIDDDAMEAAWVRIDKVIPKGRSRMVTPEPDFGDESDAAGELAHWYAALWNERIAADADIADEELERAGEELNDSGWVVHFDQKSERWYAIPADLWLQEEPDGGPDISDVPEQYARSRAPKGGVSVGGRLFIAASGQKDGSWIDKYE